MCHIYNRLSLLTHIFKSTVNRDYRLTDTSIMEIPIIIVLVNLKSCRDRKEYVNMTFVVIQKKEKRLTKLLCNLNIAVAIDTYYWPVYLIHSTSILSISSHFICHLYGKLESEEMFIKDIPFTSMKVQTTDCLRNFLNFRVSFI